MFVRPCWLPPSEQDIFDLIERNRWGLLISNGETGPLVTNVAWMFDRNRGTKGVLTSHLSRANDHAAALLVEKAPVLAVFHGPSSYITSSWYPERDMPPTLYYTAVHCYGSLTFQDAAELRASIEELTAFNEKSVPNGWSTSEIPPQEITRRLPAILGFELTIERLEGKFKLGQDEPKRDALAVGERLLQSDDRNDRVLGEMVLRHNEYRL